MLLANVTYGKIHNAKLAPFSWLCLIITHPECLAAALEDADLICVVFPQVKNSYVNFLNHCYVDTEVEMKEIYTSNHIWTLFEDFLVDMARVRQCADIK